MGSVFGGRWGVGGWWGGGEGKEGKTYRQKFPADFFALPALRLEVVGVGTPDVGAAVEGVDRVVDGLAFGDEDFGFAVGAAAAGEGGVFVCCWVLVTAVFGLDGELEGNAGCYIPYLPLTGTTCFHCQKKPSCKWGVVGFYGVKSQCFVIDPL